MRTILSAVVSAALALGAVQTNAESKAAEAQVTLSIKSITLADALDMWAARSGLQLFGLNWKLAEKLAAPSIEGTFSAQVALEKILEGTPFTYEWINDRAVAIRERSRAATPVTSGSGLDPSGQQRIRVAQLSGDEAGGRPALQAQGGRDGSSAGSAGTNDFVETLEEVIVIGSHIKGIVAAGSAVKVYSREQLDRSNAATLEQFSRTMVEQFSTTDSIANPNSTASFATFSLANGNNIYQGSAFNLRGLGPGATLTLLNGQRLAAAGFDGAFVDISLIPLSAVDHIEVLTDGASAIYGADAVAGVVNVVTRKDFDGAETALRYGSTSDGGASQRTAAQLFGRSWDGGNAFFSYHYDDQDALDVSQRDYVPDQGGAFSLVPNNRRNSFFFSASQALGPTTTLSADMLYSKREFATSRFINNAIYALAVQSSGDAELYSGALRLSQSLFADWALDLTGAVSRNEQADTGVGVMNLGGFVLNSTQESAAEPRMVNFDLILQGPILQTRAGAIKGAFGASHRTEKFSSSTTTSDSLGRSFSSVIPTLDREVTSAYGEIFIPLIGREDSTPGAQRLELSLAARYDDYDDFGSTTNPKFGVAWEPIGGLSFRGTYGTSFQAPLLSRSGGPEFINAVPTVDSASPFGFANAVFLSGGNRDLTAEESTSVTGGFDWKPASAFSLGVTYFRVKFEDRTSTPPTSGGIVNLADPLLAPFVTRNPPLATVVDYFNRPEFTGDFTFAGPAGIQAVYDGRFANIATTEQSGVDVSAHYDVPVSTGRLRASAAVTRFLKLDFRAVDAAPSTELVDTFGQPTKWKGRLGVVWSPAQLTAGLFVNYVNGYDNSLFTPARPIDSWTTGDFYLSYQGPKAATLMRNVTVALSINNITNERPPNVNIPASLLLPGQNAALPYDAANASPLGRTISVSATKRWGD